MIDLHRDAAAASATEGKYLEIDGKRVAKFSMVVGQQNDNYTELYAFAKKVSERSEALHKGYGGAIIEQNYRYNEFVSDRALLLEIGNNKNTIEETRLCAKYFAEVLAGIIKEEQQ
ncbi:MAG: stage II sporulation protein P [Clostridia bacterium]